VIMLNALIVDDSSIDILLIRSILEDGLPSSASIIAFTESIVAKKHIDLHPIKILVTDIEMPGVDGFELIEYTRKKHPESVIIAVSGSNFDDNATNTILYAAKGVGANHVICKSNLFEDLTNVINSVCDSCVEH